MTDTSQRPTVVHVVATDNFAGVEQYVGYVAGPLTERGWRVIVVGGEAERMEAITAPAGVDHVRAASLAEVTRALVRIGRVGIVHAHMTTAETAAVLAKPRNRAPIMVTRHFAARRGSSPAARGVGAVIRAVIARQVSISQFVADAIGERSIVLLNGVPGRAMGAHDQQIVLVAQRFELEKETRFAIDAWAESGLAEVGWRMQIAGRGSEDPALRRLAVERGVDGSVEFLGFVDDLGDRMSNASIFFATAPSEPFGLSVAEAMACGSSVVVVDGGAHRELVGPSTKNSLVGRGRTADAAALLRLLALDPARRAESGIALRERQIAELSISVHADRLDALYRAVLKG